MNRIAFSRCICAIRRVTRAWLVDADGIGSVSGQDDVVEHVMLGERNVGGRKARVQAGLFRTSDLTRLGEFESRATAAPAKAAGEPLDSGWGKRDLYWTYSSVKGEPVGIATTKPGHKQKWLPNTVAGPSRGPQITCAVCELNSPPY